MVRSSPTRLGTPNNEETCGFSDRDLESGRRTLHIEDRSREVELYATLGISKDGMIEPGGSLTRID